MSDVLVRTEGSSMVVTLNRPERANAVGGEMFGQLIEAVEAGDEDPEIRAIVTTGTGKGYCVGMDANNAAALGSGPLDFGEIDLDEVSGRTGLRPLTPEAHKVDHLGIGRWVLRFAEVGTPTIAAINGATAGGGMALALLHDLRVMSRTAKIAPSFPTLGLGAEMGITWMLPRIVGHSRAFRALVRSTPIGAEEALDLGLVDEVVDPGDVLPRALELAAPFASVADRSARAIKRQLRESWHSTLADQLEREWVMQRILLADSKTSDELAALRDRLGSR